MYNLIFPVLCTKPKIKCEAKTEEKLDFTTLCFLVNVLLWLSLLVKLNEIQVEAFMEHWSERSACTALVVATFPPPLSTSLPFLTEGVVVCMAS